MYYKDLKSTNPNERTRALRRLWLVKVFEGDPDDPETPIREETVIAWNAVDANRQIQGQLAVEPEQIGWVTWPREGEDHVYMIENTTDGPLEDETIVPSVGSVQGQDPWDF